MEERRSHVCLDHSGLNTKLNIVISLSSLVAVLLGFCFPLLYNIHADGLVNRNEILSHKIESTKYIKKIENNERTSLRNESLLSYYFDNIQFKGGN